MGSLAEALARSIEAKGGELRLKQSVRRIPGLYLCGSSCHPGPGVTFLPGYGCGKELLATALRRPIPSEG